MTGSSPSKYENLSSFEVRVTVTKPVWFRVEGLRKHLKTKDVTD